MPLLKKIPGSLSLGLGLLLVQLTGFHAAKAQDSASITGVVSDSSGAVIPGATVTLSNSHLGVSFTQTTDARGTYRFPNVPPSPSYTEVFSHAGFASLTAADVALNVGSTRTQDARLAIAGATAQVTVSADSQADTLNTTDASIGNNLDPQVLNELPVQDRSSGIQTLFYLQPGVDINSGAVTGARTDQSEVTVDGLDVNDLAGGTTFATVTHAPVDSVEEFRGVVAGMPIATGTGSGGQFQLVTKSGTNQFHGAVNEYNRNTDTAANTWYGNNLGLARTALIRNQFGGNIGGPIKRDKLFFFFDVADSRIIQSSTVQQTVPLDSFRNGTLNYITSDVDPATGQTCADGSRLNTNPACIANLSSAQVAALDPAGAGFNQALVTFINSRYPHSNEPTEGDGVNTGGYAFTASMPDNRIDYVGRIDYNLSRSQRVFGRFTIGRENTPYAPPEFSGDPYPQLYIDRSYGYVVSHEWEIGGNKVNQAYYGDTISKYDFPFSYNPTGASQYRISGLSAPYYSTSGQDRRLPVPEVRDDFNWLVGNHALNMGGTFKFIKTDSELLNNFNFVGIGQIGNSLYGGLGAPGPGNTIVPQNLGTGPSAEGDYYSLFPAALGVVGAISSNFDYDNAGTALAQGSGSRRNYRYFETELYAGDTWKVTSHLTLSYGLRYMIYSVPYETHGDESIPYESGSDAGTLSFNNYFGKRMAQSAEGKSGNNAIPFISYKLGGKANSGPSLYSQSYNDLAPRFALSYNPSWAPKSVFNLGAGIVYDRTVINAINFIQDQSSYLFQGTNTTQFGTSSPAGSLAIDPRVGAGLSVAKSLIPVPLVIATPYTPYVDSTGTPFGLAEGSDFNYAVDPKLKDPYSIALNAGIQQELPGHFIMKLNYAGRLGRRLIAQADASQIIDNPDPVSGQLMSAAFTGLEQQVRAGANPSSAAGLTEEPWFANVVQPGFGLSQGYANNTSLIGAAVGILGNRGDMADMLNAMATYTYFYGQPLLPTNVGMASQLAGDTFITNKGFSSYNGLLFTLSRNLSQGLQFNFNYTWSHSIDNTSLVANSIAANTGYGFLCDATRPRECRGNSDFDIQNELNANFVYNLPFGHNRQFLSNSPRWLDEAIGGWSVSGIPSYRTGLPLNVFSAAFIAGFASEAPAIFIGKSKNDLRARVNKQNGSYFQFTNPAQAFADFSNPVGLEIGHRNDFRGPGAFAMDAGIAKTFHIVPNERLNLKFRADAFNVFNHSLFGNPGLSLFSGSNFGQITGGPGGTSAGALASYAPRVLQGSLRLEF